VDNFGQVGIGTTTPYAPLEVVGGSIHLRNTVGSATVKITTDGFASGDYAAVSFATDVNGTKQTGWIGLDHHNNVLKLVSGTPPPYNNNNGLVVNSAGAVGIGVLPTVYPLEIANGAYVTITGVWTDASSRELKENIKPLPTTQALAVLQGMTPVTFNYKVDKIENHVGFIAEDVPELVATKDRKGLSSMDIVAVLTKVVQDQQAKLETKQKQLSALQDENERQSEQLRKQNARLARIEALLAL